MRCSQRLVLIVLMCFFVSLAMGGTLFADPATWARIPTTCGNLLYDWEIQNWIDEYFQDGAPSDGKVESNIVSYFTQCYAGDCIDNFNGTKNDPVGGYPYDLVAFTNSSAYAANQPGLGTKYHGYHDDAAAAVRPENSSHDAHNAGIAGKHHAEDPFFWGQDQPLQGVSNTHVLIYAGNPEGPDLGDIEFIHNAYDGLPNTTVNVLSGSGSTTYADGAATKANMRDTLSSIGSQMDENSTFIFFVTDHGGLAHVEADPPPVMPYASVTLDLPDWDNEIFIGLPDLPSPPPDPSDLVELCIVVDQPIPNPDEFTIKLTAAWTTPFMISLADEKIIKETIDIPSPDQQARGQQAVRYRCMVPGDFVESASAKGYFELINNGQSTLNLISSSIELTAVAKEVAKEIVIPGDANSDGKVDDKDAAILAAHWLMEYDAIWSDGDFNADQRVDFIDATILASNWQVDEAEAVSIPEPSMLALLLLGTLVMVVPRKKSV